ncbi:MAG: hybrid sensor histidine kinase/response regulator [Anaerolineae bacterium]
MNEKAKTILLIEDNHDIRQNIASILELEGFEVKEAENGGTGLGMLQLFTPDLIISDISMPDFDGFQILQHVRQSAPLKKIPFLFLTALTDRKSMRQGMELGADDYLTKPFTNEELLSAVYSRLRRQETLLSDQGNDRQNAEELEKAKKNLTQMVAHELRTPLTSVVMIEQLIDKKFDSLSKDQIKDLLDSWKAGTHRLQHLVEQMVLMTQIDTNELNENTIDLRGTAQDIRTVLDSAVAVARRFAYRHPHGNVRVNNSTHRADIQCHSQSLRHAFAEIVSNALDFTTPGTDVLINQKHSDQTITISIVDTGSGMTTRKLQRALTPFEQIDRQKREQQGMGLGLPIAKKIIELHRGNIIFQQVASGGTKVIIQLPRHDANEDDLLDLKDLI